MTTTTLNYPYAIISSRFVRVVEDASSLESIISIARTLNEEYQPAYGTAVEDNDGAVVWCSEDDE